MESSKQHSQAELDRQTQDYVNKVHNKNPEKESFLSFIGLTKKSTEKVLNEDDLHQTAIDVTGMHIPIKTFADRDILDEANKYNVSFMAMKNHLDHGVPLES